MDITQYAEWVKNNPNKTITIQSELHNGIVYWRAWIGDAGGDPALWIWFALKSAMTAYNRGKPPLADPYANIFDY